MTEPDTIQADYKALNDLIVNCPEFSEFETRLGDFNLFQVLRSEFAELKHSNVIAWLLDPDESHGLGELFLQKWLMRALHTSSSPAHSRVTPVDIDAWELWDVEIRREWQHIDLLLILKMVGGATWVVCIENKVNATQSPGQLSGYRDTVEKEFAMATHRLFFFLTKSNEEPEDDAFVPASYADVHKALTDAITVRRLSVGQEPKVLIDNYLRLLEEKFMNESDIARMALTIYKKHHRAIDVIFAHRPGSYRSLIMQHVGELLDERANELGIISGPNDKDRIRFIPKAWDVPGNHFGTSWLPSNVGVLFELEFFTEFPHFMIVAGQPPQSWALEVQSKCNGNGFKHILGQSRKGQWPRLYSEDIIGAITDASMLTDVDEAAKAIFTWIKARLASSDLKTVIETIAMELPKLEQMVHNESLA